MIYLDHNATTPVDPEVIDLITNHMEKYWHNPSGIYATSQRARAIIEEAREIIAEILNAHSSEIYFTSSGTEGDNMLIKGVLRHGSRKGMHIIASGIEHPAVYEAIESMAPCGCSWTFVKPDSRGLINPEDIKNEIRDETSVISVMHANNETGCIQDIETIGNICRERGILFHTDAVQTVGKLPLDMKKIPVDILTASAHKFYGPRGAGFIYIRRGVKVEPLLHGGGQEAGYRASTENTAGIAGMALALQIGAESFEVEQRLSCLRDRMLDIIKSGFSEIVINGEGAPRLGGTLNITFPGVNAQSLAMALDIRGVCVSTGSACSAGMQSPSRTLTAMGIDEKLTLETIRISLGRENNTEQIEKAAEIILAEALRLKNR